MTTFRERIRRRGDDVSPHLIDQLRTIALPLEDAADLDPLIERIGDARFVMLGEASHGTAEYYNWRTRVSQRLIEEKGFRFIAVEGDWPDCYRIDRYVKHMPDAGADAREALSGFRRWPTWMWANIEVGALAEWLHKHNDGLPEERQAGFFGLDVYSLWESLEAITQYLERIDPDAAAVARRAFRCFDPYGRDAQEYARATDMARAGMVNAGQLVREGVVLVGFAGHHGSVIAGREWGAPMERMTVPPARAGSWEDLIHRAGQRRQPLILEQDALTPEMWQPRGHRAIGVVYDPAYERFGNYVETVQPARYDVVLSFDDTRALHPMGLPVADEGEPPQTHPWTV